jgi:hypothetical protein
MHDQVKLRDAVKGGEGGGNFGFGVFAGSFERSDVAVAQAGPIAIADFALLAMKIGEAEFFAEFASLVVSFVITGQDPEASAEWFQNFAATIEALTEIGKIAGGDIDIRGLGDDAFETAQIAVRIAEDQNLHCEFPAA